MTPLQHRIALLCAVLLAGIAGVRASTTHEQLPPRESLANLPPALGSWTPAGDIAIDEESLRVLNADDYVSRTYVRRESSVGSHQSAAISQQSSQQSVVGIDLFIAYYASQRQGETMHSPLNCLPATGWQPLSSDDMTMSLGAPPLTARRVVIQKGLDRQLVIYWYQSHGRTMASEYASKAYLVLDSIRRHRSDAAIVRVVAPVDGEAGAIDFIRALQPVLHRYIPD